MVDIALPDNPLHFRYVLSPGPTAASKVHQPLTLKLHPKPHPRKREAHNIQPRNPNPEP